MPKDHRAISGQWPIQISNEKWKIEAASLEYLRLYMAGDGSVIRDRAGIRSSRLMLPRPDGLDQFDYFLKQRFPIVLGFDQAPRPHLQALAQTFVPNDFERRVGESLRRLGDHQVFPVNDAQPGDGLRGGDDGLASGHGLKDFVLHPPRDP